MSFYLLTFFASLFFLHPIHVSVSTVEFNPRTGSIEIIHKIFIDDLEKHLEEIYGDTLRLGTERQHTKADEHLKSYIENRFALKFDDEDAPLNFVGWESDLEAVWIYQEITDMSDAAKSVEVRQQVLFGFYQDQKNLVHVELGAKKKSFILTTEQPSEKAFF